MSDVGFIPDFTRELQQGPPSDLTYLQLLFVLRQIIYSESLNDEERRVFFLHTLDMLPRELIEIANTHFEGKEDAVS